MEKNYKKLLITLSISFAIMYSVMFLNVASVDHVYFSLTRVYMALLMISPMALLMLLSMKNMYKNKKLNKIFVVVSICVFVLSLFFLRNQTFISDEQYMKAMIPHHSSAILTSENANIEDPGVKNLSEEIIVAQEQEIDLMKNILAQ